MILDEKEYLAHYGTPRHSGRYPWGSGDNENTRNKDIIDYIEDMKSQGLTDQQIMDGLGIKSTEYRARKSNARAERKAADHAKELVRQKDALKNILVVAHEEYPPGVIGLVAGKLVEEFYRPSIVLSIGETHSKASARSISGFNIIEFLRTARAHLVDVGGHPMAAGFTIETKNLTTLQEFLESSVDTFITEELLVRTLTIDCELPFTIIEQNLYKAIQQLAPFGMGNPEPVFASRGVRVDNMRLLGKENTHLKLWLKADGKTFEAIAFGMGSLANDMQIGDSIDVAYSLDENTWNGNTKLQLKIKDITLP